MTHSLSNVILVHGTWGKKSPFAFPDSDFCKTIEESSESQFNFSRFEWSGDNSTKARLDAANELFSLIKESRRNSPTTKIYVIAHSHGGMVALYAARREANLVDGICCMSTPFLIPVARRWEILTKFNGLALFIFVAAGVVPLMIAILGMTLGYFWGEDAAFMSVGLILMIFILFSLFWASVQTGKKNQTRSDLVDKFVAIASSRTKAAMDRLSIPSSIPRMFAVSVWGDEAFNWLLLILGISDYPYRFFVWWWIAERIAMAMAVVLLPFAIMQNYYSNIIWILWSKSAVTLFILSILGILCFPAFFIAVGWLGKLRFTLGESSIIDSCFVRIKTTKEPPITCSLWNQKVSVRGQLRHSVAYLDDGIIRRIARWLVDCEAGDSFEDQHRHTKVSVVHEDKTDN